MFRMSQLPGGVAAAHLCRTSTRVVCDLAAIVGESWATKEGLGTLILYANGNLDTARVFSILLVLAATGTCP